MQVKINGAKYVTQADTRVLIDALSQPLSYQVLLLSDEEKIKEEVIITVCRAERYVGRFNM